MDKLPRIQGGLSLAYGLLFAAAAAFFAYTVRDRDAKAEKAIAEADAKAEKAMALVNQLGKDVEAWSKTVEERLKAHAPAAGK
jgi:hypothetical protein